MTEPVPELNPRELLAQDVTEVWGKVKTVLLLFFGLVALGTFGYMLIEGWDALDSVYMTIITIASVGYREVGPLHFWGRIFTMSLIFFGLIVVSVFVASVTSLYVERELQKAFRSRRMLKQIQKLRDHVILCGAGDTGRQVIEEFHRVGQPLVAIEKNPEHVQGLSEAFPDLPIIEGDATKDETLVAANIQHARGLISSLAEDADNLFVVISARALNPNLYIVARAVDPHTQQKLVRAGANHVISPNVIEGLRMASVVLRPSVVDFLEIIMRGGEVEMRLEEIDVPDDSPLIGRSLRELQIPQRTGLIVLAIRRKSGRRFELNPGPQTVLHAGDRLIVLGEINEVDLLRTYLRTGTVPEKPAVAPSTA
ncbi:MAG TPA: potassium channel protein [Bacteroidetes bacterium]|nr:potassium channel protein [Bacteroidota bacterium]